MSKMKMFLDSIKKMPGLIEEKAMQWQKEKPGGTSMFDHPIYGESFRYWTYGKLYFYRLYPKGGRNKPPRVNYIFGRVKKGGLSEFMDHSLNEAKAVNSKGRPLLFASFGRGEDGTPVVYDFTNVRQLLVSGMSGHGKTKAMMILLLSMAWGNHPSALEVKILDMKNEDLNELDGIFDYYRTLGSIHRALQDLEQRIKYVQKRLVANGHKTIDTYNLAAKESGRPFLKYHLTLIEEYATLFDEIPEAQKIVAYISRIGRSAGVYLILSTQRADAKVIDSQIKANMTGIYSFAQMDEINARVAGIPEAANIKDVGEAYLRVGHKLKKVKVPNLSLEDTRMVVSNLKENALVFKKPNEK